MKIFVIAFVLALMSSIAKPQASHKGKGHNKPAVLSVSDLTTDLRADWELTLDSKDSTPNALDLTNIGGVPFGPNGASFNGTNQFLTRIPGPNLDLTNSDFFICGFVSPTGFGSPYGTPLPLLFSASYISDRLEFGPALNGDGTFWLESDINQSGGVWTLGDGTTDSHIPFGTQVFAATWFNSSTSTVYLQVNDGPVLSDTLILGGPYQQAEIDVGGSQLDGVFLAGTIKYLRVWIGASAIKSAADRTWLYNGGAGRTYAEILLTH